SHRDTTRSDFSLASSLANIDLVRTPGRVLLADTSQAGPVQNITFQPDPASIADNFLYAGNSNQNYGNAAQLFVGNWSNGTWTRSILQFPGLPLPTNATIVNARLELYYSLVIDATPMDISVHAVTSNWTEFGSTWNSADGIAPWNAAGGDFDPTAVATVAGITNGTGWYGWNVTSLVVGWWTSAVPDDGLMVRQVSDTSAVMGQKGFSSSEDPNTTRRPRLQLAYTTPSSHGRLLSAPIAAGGLAQWTGLWWNATVPSGANVTLRFRTGGSVALHPTWSLLTINSTAPAGTSVSAAYSSDNGTSWLPASSDQDLSAALVHGIRLQITFATNDTLVSPRVESVTLRYRIASGALGNPAVS